MAENKDKPAYDEQTLARLLEAAFVIQEHGEELRQIRSELGRDRGKTAAQPTPPNSPQRSEKGQEAKSPPAVPNGDAAYASTLAQVLETQYQIHNSHPVPDAALSLIAEQAIEICGAAGAAIGVAEGKELRYRAVAGIRTLPAGSSVPADKALCFPCMRTGQVFSCGDVKAQILVDAEECSRRGIGSFIAVPVFHTGGVLGGLELYFSDSNAFNDQDIHTCQLMAALASEALAEEEKPGSGAMSRATASVAERSQTASLGGGPKKIDLPSAGKSAEQGAPLTVCYKCGHKLIGEEQFCGKCGAPRSTTADSRLSMQSKVASLWRQHQAEELKSPAPPLDTSTGAESETVESASGKIVPGAEVRQPVAYREIATGELERSDDEASEESSAGSAPEEGLALQVLPPDAPRSADWSSALSARVFLEQFATNRRGLVLHFWNKRRGDIYLAVAVILVSGVILWAWRSNQPARSNRPPAPTTHTHKQPAPPQLSLVERMLIGMGLAEAPPPPENKGNPSTQVWEDLQTGLYYCPGNDLYGKTPKGKYTSQRDAELDRYEPAYRRVCD